MSGKSFGLLAVSPKSLFISFFDYVERGDEESWGTAVLGCKQEGFNPHILVTDLLPTYRVVASYFKTYLYQLCTNHARRDITKIFRNLPTEAKKDKFFLKYMVKISMRFCALFKENNIGRINSHIGQIKRELKLFYTEEKRKWAEPVLKFIERNSNNLFLYKKLPEKRIDSTNNASLRLYLVFLNLSIR